MTSTSTPAKRPTTTRKRTRTSEQKRDEQLDTGLALTIDGEKYQARLGDVTPAIARRLRRETGMSFMRLINEFGEDPDVDLLCAFVWVARLIRGDDVELEDVEGSIGYAEMLAEGFDVDVAGSSATDGDSPEA